MTNKEKVIAAFFVSLGLFSVAQAGKYVGMISEEEKNSLFVVANGEHSNVLLCDGVHDFTDPNVKKVG